MRDKLLRVRIDAEFLSKLDYIQRINGYKTQSETVRKTIEKEWRKEQNGKI